MKIKFSESFIHGFVRVLDLGGTKDWPEIPDDKLVDYKAIRSDWENVGRIIKRETGAFKRS